MYKIILCTMICFVQNSGLFCMDTSSIQAMASADTAVEHNLNDKPWWYCDEIASCGAPLPQTMAISSCGNMRAFASKQLIYLFENKDLKKWKYIQTGGRFGKIQFSPCNQFLATTDNKFTGINIFSTTTTNLTSNLYYCGNDTIKTWIGDFCYSPDGKYIASVSVNGLCVFDLLTNKLSKHIKLDDKRRSWTICYSSDSIIMNQGTDIVIYCTKDWVRQVIPNILEDHTNGGVLPVYNMACFPSGKRLLITASSSLGHDPKKTGIIIFDLEQQKIVSRLECHSQKVYGSKQFFSPYNGMQAFSPHCSHDGKSFIVLSDFQDIFTFKHFDQCTPAQVQLKELVHLFLCVKKPKKNKIDSFPKLLSAIVNTFRSAEHKTVNIEILSLFDMCRTWESLPEKVRNDLWINANRCIQRYGK